MPDTTTTSVSELPATAPEILAMVFEDPEDTYAPPETPANIRSIVLLAINDAR